MRAMSKLRVLVITGSAGPQSSAAVAIGEALAAAGMTVRQAPDSNAAGTLDDTRAPIDCVVLTPTSHFTDNDLLSLEDFVRRGGGLVAVGAPGGARERPDMMAGLLGFRVSEYRPAFEYRALIADPIHPIAQRIPDFVLSDELPILEKSVDHHTVVQTWWAGRHMPLLFVRPEGKGRVAVLANGRSPSVHRHPAWRQLLVRAVRHAAGEEWAKRTVKVGVIGYGGAFNMGRLHAESCVKARMQPVAVCDLDPRRTAAARGELGEHVHVYSDVGRMLAESDCELCIVVTPHNTHAALSIQCLEAGRHVVTEKPYTITVDEATRVIDTARRVGKVATVFHNRRWDGDFLTMKRLVESGTIGEVFHVECFFGGYGEPRPDWWRSHRETSGGALYDWGAHFADWVLQLVNRPIESVAGVIQKRVWHQITNEDHSEALIRFAGGATASIQQSSIAAIPKSRFRILGTHGAIEQRTAEPKEGIRVVGHHQGVRTESTVACGPGDWDAFYRNLADHLLLGEPLAVTPESARDVISVLWLAEESARRGGAPLALPYAKAAAAG